MRSNHQLATKNDVTELNSNRSNNSRRVSWHRTAFSITLTTCLSFGYLPAVVPAVNNTVTKSQKDFYYYCAKGDCKKLQSLLNKKPTDLDLDQVANNSLDPNHKTMALIVASANGHLCIVKELLKAGADPNGMNGERSITTILTKAAYDRHLGIVQELLKAGADPNKVSPSGDTALIVATGLGYHLEIPRGTVTNNNRYTALSAARNNNRLKIAQELFKAEIKSNKNNTNSETELISSVLFGRLDNMQALLKAGVDPNKAMYHGQSALMYALINGDPKVVQALLQAGADPNKVDNHGQTVLMFALCLNVDPKVIQVVLKAGADPNKVSNYGHTALAMAASMGYFDNIQTLLKAGAGPDLKNHYGETIFDITPNKKTKALFKAALAKAR